MAVCCRHRHSSPHDPASYPSERLFVCNHDPAEHPLKCMRLRSSVSSTRKRAAAIPLHRSGVQGWRNEYAHAYRHSAFRGCGVRDRARTAQQLRPQGSISTRPGAVVAAALEGGHHAAATADTYGNGGCSEGLLVKVLSPGGVRRRVVLATKFRHQEFRHGVRADGRRQGRAGRTSGRAVERVPAPPQDPTTLDL